MPILQTRCTSYINLQWYHDGPLHRNKGFCHIVLPCPTKYNTTHIRHTLMDAEFHHCKGTHCLGHHDLNEVTSHLHDTVTFMWTTTPLKKKPPPLSELAPIWVTTSCFPPIRVHATNDQPMHILHPTPGYAFPLPCQEGQVPVSTPPVRTNPNPISTHKHICPSSSVLPLSIQTSKPNITNYPAVTQLRC